MTEKYKFGVFATLTVVFDGVKVYSQALNKGRTAFSGNYGQHEKAEKGAADLLFDPVEVADAFDEYLDNEEFEMMKDE